MVTEGEEQEREPGWDEVFAMSGLVCAFFNLGQQDYTNLKGDNNNREGYYNGSGRWTRRKGLDEVCRDPEVQI